MTNFGDRAKEVIEEHGLYSAMISTSFGWEDQAVKIFWIDDNTVCGKCYAGGEFMIQLSEIIEFADL